MNIVATYGRSVYSLACGLFVGRWILQALGHDDFGLYGVIGGLTLFITYFSGMFGAAVSRYYAYSVGEARKAKNADEGIDNCRKWFNAAVFLYAVIPLLIAIIGYPIAEWAILDQKVKVPPDRVEACLWVLRIACLSSYIGMITVPFNAMFIAKQYISELTIYSVITTTVNVCGIYYMVSHPGVWLVKYALWAALMHILSPIFISIRAMIIFPECRFRRAYLHNWSCIKSLCSFAGWQIFGVVGAILRTQGIAILINNVFGSKVNAANSTGTSLSTHCDTLSGSMISAFSPAITNACGEKNFKRMRDLAFRCCKIGTLLIMVFALPLIVEMDEVLLLWLRNPPKYTNGLAISILIMMIIDKTTVGHMLAVNAMGKIAKYQAMVGTTFILALPFAILFTCVFHWGVYSVGYALILAMMMATFGRMWMARSLAGMSGKYWVFKIILPLAFISLVTMPIGFLPRLFISASFGRVCVTTILMEFVLFMLSWLYLLDGEERNYVVQKVKTMKSKLVR